MLVKLFNQVVWQDFYEDRSNEEEAKAEKRTVSIRIALHISLLFLSYRARRSCEKIE
jgi:hypothetical protein